MLALRASSRRRLTFGSLTVAPLFVLVLHLHCSGNDAPAIGLEGEVDGAVGVDVAEVASDASGDVVAVVDGSDAESDAPVEAGPREAGTITDAGFIVTASDIGILCVDFAPGFGDGSTVMCPASTTECCFNFPDPRCVDSGTGACGLRFGCDGPEDCAPGESCRSIDSGAVWSCAAGFQERDYCHETAQCPNGYLCCQQKLLLDDGGYAPPPTAWDTTEYIGFTNGVCLNADGDLGAWRCDR